MKGPIQNKVCPYLSYDGDIGPGLLGAVPCDQASLRKALESWGISYRPTAATRRDCPDVKDYPYDTGLEIYEARPDMDLLMHSESDSDGDSFSSFFKSLDEDDDKKVVQEEEKDSKGTPVQPVTVLTSQDSVEASKFSLGYAGGSAQRAIQPSTRMSTRSSVVVKRKPVEVSVIDLFGDLPGVDEGEADAGVVADATKKVPMSSKILTTDLPLSLLGDVRALGRLLLVEV